MHVGNLTVRKNHGKRVSQAVCRSHFPMRAGIERAWGILPAQLAGADLI
jgi:hypothetical protein